MMLLPQQKMIFLHSCHALLKHDRHQVLDISNSLDQEQLHRLLIPWYIQDKTTAILVAKLPVKVLGFLITPGGSQQQVMSLRLHVSSPVFHEGHTIPPSLVGLSDKQQGAKWYVVPEKIEPEQTNRLAFLQQDIALLITDLLPESIICQMLIKALPKLTVF